MTICQQQKKRKERKDKKKKKANERTDGTASSFIAGEWCECELCVFAMGKITPTHSNRYICVYCYCTKRLNVVYHFHTAAAAAANKRTHHMTLCNS